MLDFQRSNLINKGTVMDAGGKVYNNEIILVRGLPGSGKSTMAKAMVGYLHLEADMYLQVNGEYVYDGSKLEQPTIGAFPLRKKRLRKVKMLSFQILL